MDCKTWVPEHELICCSNKNCEHAFVLKAFFFNCDCLLFYFKTWIVQACNLSKHWIKAMSSSLLVGSNCEHLLCLKPFCFPFGISSLFHQTSFFFKIAFFKLGLLFPKNLILQNFFLIWPSFSQHKRLIVYALCTSSVLVAMHETGACDRIQQ